MATFAGGTLRVTTPGSYDAQPAGARTDRGLPGDPGAATEASKDALVKALEQSDLALVERVDLTPRRTRDLGDKPASNRAGKVKLEVDVPPDEDAVVLLERDGVYSWHLPVNPAERTKSIDPGPRTARFEIDVQPLPPDRPTTRRRRPPVRADGTRTRGLLGNLVQGAAQALVFRFAAPALLEKALERMEKHVRPGLVHLTDADVSKWRRFETLDQLHLPTDRPVRVLLFVHGTFSSTVGGFGALAIDENGKGFLRTAISAYDAVIGFDHKTLSLDPLENAQNLLKRLRTHRPGAEFVIDIITHSRGGLVTRSFAEQVLPASGWPGTVDIAVFVAATNAGTHLADPERWTDLVDLYTNLASVSASGLSLLPGAAPVAAVVGGMVKGIGAFVKYLVSYAAEGEDVPGLKAMVPGGAFVTRAQQAPGRPAGTGYELVRRVLELPRAALRRPSQPAGVPARARRQARGRLRRPDLRGRQRPRRRHRLHARDRPGGRRVRRGHLRARRERPRLPQQLLQPAQRDRGDRGLAAPGPRCGRRRRGRWRSRWPSRPRPPRSRSRRWSRSRSWPRRQAADAEPSQGQPHAHPPPA